MILSEYIKGLQETLEEHGDLEVVYATDDGGNFHHKVNWTGTPHYFESLEPSYYLERTDDENDCKAIVIN